MTAPIPRDLPDLPALPGTASSLLPSPVPATAVVPRVRRPLAAAYRMLTAVAALTAVTITLLRGSPARVLSDFAVQSTLFLALVLLMSARRAWSARHPLPGSLAGAALLYTLLAFLVHHTLLADAAPAYAPTADATHPAPWPTSAADLVIHTVVPLAALLDWLLLSPPGRMRLRQTAPWLLYPLVYLIFVLARGELLPGTPARYLYPFLDVDQHGYRGVLGNALLLGLALYALAVLLVALDHARPNPVRRRRETGFRLQPPVG
ncbi:Pr6Pr family membrane protein [Streptomyces sp. NPDC005931]|uniref:Pr6Pr family membrane protein n=1 Tax=Streptomyces sp. NPDC005931 TaxID=3364737 RepID=UPI00367B9FD2